MQWFKSTVNIAYSLKKKRLRIGFFYFGFAAFNSLFFYLITQKGAPAESFITPGMILPFAAFCYPLWVPLVPHLIHIALTILVLRIFNKEISPQGFITLTSYLLLQTSLTIILNLNTQKLRRKTREAEKAYHSKNQFLANMSHEIRSPLTGIVGFSHILITRNFNPDDTKMVRIIHDSGQRLLTIVNDILDYSSLLEGQIPLKYGTHKTKELLESLTEHFRLQASKKGISFQIETPTPLPETLYIDSVRIHQIIDNLLNNALKFTDEGSILLNINITDDQITFIVKDTGCGISQAEITDIFNHFYQGDASYQKKVQGKGLGLAICNELVHLLDGTINVTSTEGEGSRFKVVLPRRYEDGES